MTKTVKKLLKRHNAASLKELAGILKVSYTKIRDISCGRVKFKSLYKNRQRHEVLPKRSEKLAELIGIVLGDGNIQKFARCQRLVISCDRKYFHKTNEIKKLVYEVLKKEPKIYKRSSANCDDVCLYMQNIDKALGIKAGNKIKNRIQIPSWILENKRFSIKCLKGLFETDGTYATNKKAYVKFIEFENKCPELRLSTYRAVKNLGYNPQLGSRYVRLARKKEVDDFVKEINYFKCTLNRTS